MGTPPSFIRCHRSHPNFTYTYDADGNRVKKTNGTTGTLYWYMTPGIVAESDLSGVLKSEYVFFAGERVARRDLPAGSVAYYFSDHLKTASVITDSLGNIKSESDYYPWGGELQFVNNDSNHYKFTGKERDETGLDYFGARYYSNGLARFITPDWASTPIPVPYADFEDPQSLNQYSYVRNVPTVRTDEEGHDGCCEAALQELEHLVNDGIAEGRKMIDAMKPAAPLLAGGPVVAGLGALAAPSVGGMYLVATNPPVQNTPDNSPNIILDALNPPYQPPPQEPGKSQETEHTQELPPAAGGSGQQGNGRGGKQDRLKELGKDDKVSSADRGEIKRDQNQIQRGTRSTIRVPGNKDLAHRRGKEARKGYGYKHSDLQNKDLHRLQHKHEGYK